MAELFSHNGALCLVSMSICHSLRRQIFPCRTASPNASPWPSSLVIVPVSLAIVHAYPLLLKLRPNINHIINLKYCKYTQVLLSATEAARKHGIYYTAV